MKVPTIEQTILKGLTHRPLEEIRIDEVEYTIEEYESVVDSGRRLEYNDKKISTSSGFQEPFKVPAAPSMCRKTTTKTPPLGSNRLINLSYSQPSTPQTPCPRLILEHTTPCINAQLSQSTAHDFVPCTPMIINPLQVFMTPGFNNFTTSSKEYPDILELIDDDQNQIDSVDRQINMYTDVELSDETVVDYLLNVTYPESISLQEETTQTRLQPPVEDEEKFREKKKGRHTKVLTFEEREILKRIQKEKAKERRKERKQKFKRKESTAARRSTRKRKQIEKFVPV
ncbi:hypothetical protein CHS0354_023029 [Potamilus streckersoni]|uniref:Uncharacterized protein n=1 Tax=Potamilus streckersoni TaxID=2493646 RepID=A0AAE0RW82_9BIVA|nr:hypothetical protein CHS0354_023029 [Potamilus streckersoni]